MSWTHFLIFIAELSYFFLIYAIIYLKHGIIKQHNSFWAAGNILCLGLVGRYVNVLFDKSWRYINTCIIYFFIYQLILLKSLFKTRFDILCLFKHCWQLWIAIPYDDLFFHFDFLFLSVWLFCFHCITSTPFANYLLMIWISLNA